MTRPPEDIKNDLFISYAHLDNEPLAEGLSRWVEELEKRLRVRVSQLLGVPVLIWRDPKLDGNDCFGEKLLIRIENATLLLSVLSPRYIRSEYCRRELDEFCQHVGGEAGLHVGDKGRVFKIVKSYISRDEHPPLLREMTGYEFYKYDESSNRAREFNPEISPYRDERYWEKFEDLAQDITRRSAD